jgi:MoaA/NifB/PqqE/SkfB family radical SAM enzyme
VTAPRRSLPLVLGEGPVASGEPSALDLRILSHYPQVRAIRAGRIPPPRMAIVYPTYGCNLDCVGCEYAADNAAGFSFLPSERLVALMDDLADMGVESVELCGGGEPLLHKGVVDAVLHGAARGLRFGVLTNGTHLPPRFLDEALPHFAYVRFTFDAADAETYARARPTRGPSPWPELLRNARAVLAARRDAPREVSIKFLVSKVNRHQVREAAALARDLGADSLQFKALRADPAELDAAEAAEVEETIQSLRREHAPFPVLGSVGKIVMTRACELTPLQVTIDARGDVFLCCYFSHRRESHRIGNVLGEPLAAIWGSERHRAAIAGIEPRACSRFDCRFVRYHDVLDRWAGPGGDGLSFL